MFVKTLKKLQKLLPSRPVLARVVMGVAVLTVGVGGFVTGRSMVSPVGAQNPAARAQVAQKPATDYQQRVVAYIHDTIPVTREELGEFLIERFGAPRLDTLINRKIVEMACKGRGIEVTDAEVDYQFQRDLKALSPHMSVKDFENQLLRRFNKTLHEWREDIIRPKLMMAKYVQPTIQVTEEDLRKGFEGRYGPKVECRMLVLPDNNQKDQIWTKVAKNEEEFVRAATTINLGPLASSGGKVPPIHKHFGDANIERIAFGLQPGEVSQLIGMPDNTVVILKCDRHIPADASKRFESEIGNLREEIFHIKLNQRIPEVVNELRKAANPRPLLQVQTRQEDLERAVLPEIGAAIRK